MRLCLKFYVRINAVSAYSEIALNVYLLDSACVVGKTVLIDEVAHAIDKIEWVVNADAETGVEAVVHATRI